MRFYLQHGNAGGPFRTEEVPHKYDEPKNNKSTLCVYKILYQGRWYRMKFNHRLAMYYITCRGENIKVTDYSPE